MEDLLESIHWSGCEVLNATKTDAVSSLLKQGLRDQELMIVESDADEQLLISCSFKAKVCLAAARLCRRDSRCDRVEIVVELRAGRITRLADAHQIELQPYDFLLGLVHE